MPEDRPNPTIRPAPDGPYIVEGLEHLRDARGPVATQPRMALCRCGKSGNKPFCDGTHAEVGFSSEKLADRTRDRRDSYVGENITIHDNRGICAHAGKCTEGLPSVWRMGQEPWIDPNGAAAEAIIQVVESCPSGALSYSVGGVEHRAAGGPPAILVTKNGPYEVRGCVLQNAALGEGASQVRFTLCRCGGSKNKPFCDGAHWNIPFDDGSS